LAAAAIAMLAACGGGDDAAKTTEPPATAAATTSRATAVTASATAADVRACRRVEAGMSRAHQTIASWISANSVSQFEYHGMQKALRVPVDQAVDEVSDPQLVEPLLALQTELADESVASRSGGTGDPAWFPAANGQLQRLSAAANKVSQRCRAIGVDTTIEALPLFRA
jgi:hypothetical protein